MFEEPKFKVGDIVYYTENPLRRGIVEGVRSGEQLKELYGYDTNIYHIRLDDGLHVSRFEDRLEKESNMEETVKADIGDKIELKSISKGTIVDTKENILGDVDNIDENEYFISYDNGRRGRLRRHEFNVIAKADNRKDEEVIEVEEEVDMVNSPKHYKETSVECIDAMLLILGYEYTIAHCIGTAFKYLWRYRNKENPQRDLDKAKWYVDKGLDLCYEAMLDKVANKVNDKFLLERLNILTKQIDMYDDELYEENKEEV